MVNGDEQTLSLYSLRHAFAAFLINKNVSNEIAAKLLGHSKNKNNITSLVYTHKFELNALKENIEKLEIEF